VGYAKVEIDGWMDGCLTTSPASDGQIEVITKVERGVHGRMSQLDEDAKIYRRYLKW